MNALVILQQAAAPQQGGNMSFLIMMVLIFVVMYFFMIHPQQKPQKELMKFRQSLAKDEKVITAGGIYGKIKSVDETTVTMEVSNGVSIRVDKSCIYADPKAMQDGQMAGK